jgi:hypothetical protein
MLIPPLAEIMPINKPPNDAEAYAKNYESDCCRRIALLKESHTRSDHQYNKTYQSPPSEWPSNKCHIIRSDFYSECNLKNEKDLGDYFPLFCCRRSILD